jgi:hypothetical protein
MIEKALSLTKDMMLWIQEVLRTPNGMNSKKSMPKSRQW